MNGYRLLLIAGLCVLASQMSVGVIAAGFSRIPVMQQPVAPADAALRKDVYVVYSAMISFQLLRRSPSDEIYLIQATTTMGGIDLASCLKVLPGDEGSRSEILADYNRRKSVTETLEREFTLAKPYQLLSPGEVEKFLVDQSDSNPALRLPAGALPANLNPLYQTAKTVLFLSGVYFNRNRTQAAVWTEDRDTQLRSSGYWITFKKSLDGKWDWNRAGPFCSRSGVP